MKGLLLAGGHGTRLRPLTFTGNKHMLPIANKPMLYYGLKHLIDAGIKKVGIILGPISEGVRDYFGDGSNFGIKIAYLEQPDPKGLAHAIMVAQPFLNDEAFVMYLGDNLLKQGVQSQLNAFHEGSYDFVGAVMEMEDPSPYGVVLLKNGEIKRIVEKPKEFISNLALIGVYVFSPQVYTVLDKLVPSWRGEYEITDTIQHLMDTGAKVTVEKVKGWWKDTGKPEDILIANQLVLNSLESYNHSEKRFKATIENNVGIGKGTTIHKDSRIRGPVVIGENCTIGPNTFIGPYTSIGDNVKIANTEIENTIIMEEAIIDCGKRIVDSLIGRNVQVLGDDQTLPRGSKLILGDMSKVSL
jgi:glucose-1-phosphate thymidylyltransferase